jgi:hypothetical protein
MAWFGLDKLFLGTDLTAEQARSDALDAKITAANQQLESAGYVQPGYTDLASQDITAGNVSTGDANVVASVDSEFKAGAQEGLQNVLTAPGKAVGLLGSGANTILGGILKNIPWWVYAGLVAGLFVWMGGLELLKGRLARR